MFDHQNSGKFEIQRRATLIFNKLPRCLRVSRRGLQSWCFLCLTAALAGNPLQAEVTRSQSVQLKKGWNAVHLEVSPSDPEPGKVFAGTPIDVVARYFRLVTSVEFIASPDDTAWKREGWGVWYAPDREDAFLTDLYAIQGNQTYLIHSKVDHLWSVSGTVRHTRRVWRHDSYNLVGFSVDPQSPPTFAQLFEGAGAKIRQKIYRLQDGKWVKVLSPASTQVRSGEAFWTFCSGETDFQGPIDLELPGSGELDFGSRSQRLTVRWALNNPASEGLLVGIAPGSGAPLPIRHVQRDLSTLTETAPLLGSGHGFGADGARSGKFALTVRQEDLVESDEGALLRFSDGKGCVEWVPVSVTSDSD